MPDTATLPDIALDTAPPSVQVFRVAVENVTPLWGQVLPLMERALRGHITYDAEDLRKMLMGQTAHLWVQWGAAVEAIVVTEFAAYPKGLWLRIMLVGADPAALLDNEAVMAAMAQWRDMHGCRGFEAVGRMGWLRRFPEMQFVGAVMRSG